MPKGTPWVRPSRLVVRILEPVSTAVVAAATGREQVRQLAALRDDVRARIERALEDVTGADTSERAAPST